MTEANFAKMIHASSNLQAVSFLLLRFVWCVDAFGRKKVKVVEPLPAPEPDFVSAVAMPALYLILILWLPLILFGKKEEKKQK